jgi:RNA recognition motif-containing protein
MEGMVVMNKLATNKTSGVILVDNIPPQTTDSQLTDFFAEIKDVSSIQFIDGKGANHQRSCWIVVANPTETVKMINISIIAGKKPRARLMGYLLMA